MRARARVSSTGPCRRACAKRCTASVPAPRARPSAALETNHLPAPFDGIDPRCHLRAAGRGRHGDGGRPRSFRPAGPACFTLGAGHWELPVQGWGQREVKSMQNAWRVLLSARVHTAPSALTHGSHDAGMPSTGGETNGCHWMRTATPTKCSRTRSGSCAIQTLATCCTSALASRCVHAFEP